MQVSAPGREQGLPCAALLGLDEFSPITAHHRYLHSGFPVPKVVMDHGPCDGRSVKTAEDRIAQFANRRHPSERPYTSRSQQHPLFAFSFFFPHLFSSSHKLPVSIHVFECSTETSTSMCSFQDVRAHTFCVFVMCEFCREAHHSCLVTSEWHN